MSCNTSGTPLIHGSASWYDTCPTTGGGGACGTCNNNNSAQTAWANLSGTSPQNSVAYECGSDTYACCSGCWEAGQIPLESCGSVICVQDTCTGVSEAITVVDHGPWCCCCDSFTCNGTSYVNQLRIMDMTEATFAYFSNLSAGLIPVDIY